MPRILHVGKFYPPHRGGMESHLEALCLQLKGRVDLHVLVAHHSAEYRMEQIHGVSVERLGTPFSVAGTPVCPQLVAAIRRQPADIIHLHLPNPTAILAYLMSGHRGKLVFTYHSDIIRQEVLGALFRPFQDAALRRAAAIIATSPDYIDHSPVLRRFRDRCHVIPLGIPIAPFDEVDPAAVDRIRREFGPNLILSLGRHVYYKGFEYLIRAMAMAPGRLVLIGDGPLRPQLEQLAASLGIAGRVTILGEVEDTAPYYHAAEVFVLPSIARSEAFGIVQLEAMACRRPVINTQLPSGVPFVSPHGVSGICVPCEDAAALAGAIRRLIENPELRKQYGEQGRKRVEAEFTDRVMADRTIQLYEQVARREGAGYQY